MIEKPKLSDLDEDLYFESVILIVAISIDN